VKCRPTYMSWWYRKGAGPVFYVYNVAVVASRDIFKLLSRTQNVTTDSLKSCTSSQWKECYCRIRSSDALLKIYEYGPSQFFPKIAYNRSRHRWFVVVRLRFIYFCLSYKPRPTELRVATEWLTAMKTTCWQKTEVEFNISQ